MRSGFTTRAGAVALFMLGWASSASGFSYSITARTPTTNLSVGDQVVVDVFFDADQSDLWGFSVAVLGDASVLSFDGPAGDSLPVVYPAPPAIDGTTGSQPGYILYSPASGSLPAVALYPQRDPWQTWPAPAAGTVQVNLDFVSNDPFTPTTTRVTGTNIWIGSLVFDVDADFHTSAISLSDTSGGNVLSQSDLVAIDPATIGLSAPVVLTGVLPEPTTALLLTLGLAAGMWRGRRMRRPDRPSAR